jgi:hypothetical protein
MESINHFALPLIVAYICDIDCIYIFVVCIKLTADENNDI